MADSGHKRRGVRRSIAQVLRALRVAFALDDAGPATAGLRALTLGLLLAIVYAVLGTFPVSKPPKFLAKPPFDLDLALRAVSLGWFNSDRTIPITIIDIDEQTHADWNAPATTPRLMLRRMLERIAVANPTAVVVDIDLARGGRSLDTATRRDDEPLLEYLRHYDRGPPLVFPKRIEPGSSGHPRPADSPYDDVIRTKPLLSWAHASLETDKGGVLRWSQDWLLTCVGGRPHWLPSIALRTSALLGDRSVQPPQRAASDVDRAASCAQPDTRHVTRHRLLVGPRITGAGRLAGQSDALSIPARMLLVPTESRLDPRLFSGRVILIGASHSAAGDNWLTPAGVYPGVELLANSVRFLPLQGGSTGPLSRMGSRGGVILLFAMFVLFDWRYRLVFALFASMVGTFAFLAFHISVFDDFSVFDLIESAILLALVYKVLKMTLDFVAELRAQRRHFPTGWRGTAMTFRAACLRNHH